VTDVPATCQSRVLGSSPEQIAETDREFIRYVVNRYDDAIRRLAALRAELDQLERDFVGWPR
jgi:hypothetical protein